MASLGSVCKFLNGGTPSKAVPEYFEGDIPWITSADISGPIANYARSFITDEAVKNSAVNKVAAGAVLLVTRTGVGKVAVAANELCFSQDITALIPDESKLWANYLVHFLRTKKEHFLGLARGATIQGITRNVVSDLSIPLPPLPEQRRIAVILDQADALRAKRRDALAQLDSLTQSIFIEMFGDPMFNTKRLPTQKLGEVTIFENGDRSSNYPSGDDLKDEGVLFLSTKNITNGVIDLSNKVFITESKFNSLSRGKVKRNDLIITLRGTLGSCCIFDGPYETGFINAQMMIIRPSNECHSSYLHAFLTSQKIQEHFARIGNGAAVPQLTSKQFSEIVVPLPPPLEQQKFALRKQSLDSLKAAHRQSISELDGLFASLQHRAFRGEL